jgi:beta-lactamase regulating signal transducer with metallopeptidase domain/uncharacterized GH25 family protein
MNLPNSVWAGLTQVSSLSACAVLLSKATLLLAIAWLIHFALARANPRWRVLLWRGVVVGLALLAVWSLGLPGLKVRVPTPEVAATMPTPSRPPVVPGRAPIDVPQPAVLPTEVGVPAPIEITTPLDQPLADARHDPALPVGTPAPSISWQAVLSGIWGFGVILLLVRLAIGYLRLSWVLRTLPSAPERVLAEIQRVAAEMNCRRAVRVRSSRRFALPFLFGLRAPTLVLPEQMCQPAYRRQLPGIIAHELAHVRSRDFAWNAAVQAVSILLWFHPLVWWMRSAHRAACDAVCDAVSASYLGDVRVYCQTLARVALEGVASSPTAGLAMVRRCDVRRRVAALRRTFFPLALRRRRMVTFALAGLLGVAVIAGLQFVTKASSDETSPTAADQPTPPSVEKKTSPADGPQAGSTEDMLVRVVDEAGTPIGGAKLNARYAGHKADYTTDAEGKAIIVAPAPDRGYLSLIVRSQRHLPLLKQWRNKAANESIPAEFTFILEEGRRIGGVVRDEQGKPIEGVRIHVSLSSEKYEKLGMYIALWDSTFLTDREGRWHIDHAPEKTDRMAIRLEHPDYVSPGYLQQISEAQQKQVEDGTAVMVMREGIPVTGTVTGPDGKPVADALVATGADRFGSDFPSTRTDQEGHYRFANLAPGDAVLTVVSPGLAPAIRDLKVRPGIKPVDFRLEKGSTLRVRVVDRDNRPLEGIYIAPDTWRGHRTLCDTGIAGRTDREGRWTWTWAPDDPVEMSILKGGRMSVRNLPLAPQEAEHVVTLYPALTISGRVIDAETKEPTPSFRVVPGYRSQGSTPDERIYWNRREAVEGKNGQYELVIDEPRRGHCVRIEAPGHQPAISREFENDEGSVTYDFALRKGQNLNVMVRLPDGKPAAGAQVRLCPEESGRYVHTALFVENGRFSHGSSSALVVDVGADGRLSIAPQDNEFLLIVLHDQGWTQRTSEELAAEPTIALQAWARLEGVVRRGTQPLPGVKLDVDLCGPFDPRWAFLNFRGQTETDDQGEFVFAKLKPGKWRVRAVPGDQAQVVARPSSEKVVELKPGQTVKVTLGGIGWPVIGRVQWPDGKTPEGDLSRLIASVRPKITRMPTPPDEVRSKGPDAVRSWRRQWQESEEGQAWQKEVQQRSYCPQTASLDSDGRLRIENVVAGEYELEIYLPVEDERMPWERPELLRYGCDFSVPEIPGGVSDQPLNLGDMPLKDQFPHAGSSAPVRPPAPQAPGEKSVGGLRDHLELLRYVVDTYRQNKGRIQTWQGRATIHNRDIHEKTATGEDCSATVQFVFDRARKSVRWNTTLEKLTRIEKGQEAQQPVPQIVNGMQTPEGFYRLGGHGPPVNPAHRPLTLTIYSSDGLSGERIQPQLYDFNPLYYLDTSRGDVARDLSFYIRSADHPGLAGTKVIREGDYVTIDMGTEDLYNRCTVSLSQGCNPVRFCAGLRSTWEYRWTYEMRDGIWLPKTWTETVHSQDRRDAQRTVTFVESRVNEKVDAAAFSLSNLGLQRGDEVNDRRTRQKYRYDGE